MRKLALVLVLMATGCTAQLVPAEQTAISVGAIPLSVCVPIIEQSATSLGQLKTQLNSIPTP